MNDRPLRARPTRVRLDDDVLRRIALGWVAFTVLAALGAVALHQATAARAEVSAFAWASIVIGTTWPAAGAAVVHARPRNRCGWLLLGAGVLAPYQLLGEYSLWSHFVSPLPGSVVTDSISMFGFAVYLVVLPLVPMIFPDGRLPSARWRPLALSIVGAAALLAVARFLVPGGTDVDEAIDNPIWLPALEPLNYVVVACALWCNLVGVPAGVAAVAVRYRRAVGVERAQLQWLALGGVVLATGLAVSGITGNDAAFAVGLLGPPVGIAVAVLRHRLFDVGFALSRTVVFLVVVGVVGVAGTWLLLRLDPDLAGTRRGAVLVALLALAAVALRALVQRWIDRAWFPERQDAAFLGNRIARAVSSSAEPREALDELVTAVRTTLRLPYVGFAGAVRAADGVRPGEVEVLDAIALGRRIGALEVAPRRDGEGFTRQERRVLEEVAAQAAMTAYAAALVVDVERNRAAIVRATEEERRRLRNDLHDGVGPTLAALALQADALAMRLAADPVLAAEAGALRDRLREAVADVRAVSHGLRPPILDQLGLSAALRQLVEGLPTVRGTALVDELGGLSAASEVAVHAIAAEAVANAVRHSAASELRVEVERGAHELTLRVVDNGRGMPPRPDAGVGLTSMRQRAAGVGGRLEHRPVPGGGTAVIFSLPLDPHVEPQMTDPAEVLRS